jgi:hypothetical protein
MCKCFIIINSIGLTVPFCNQSCFIHFHLSFRSLLNSEDLLTINCLLPFGELNKIPCLILLKVTHLFFHCILPFWILLSAPPLPPAFNSTAFHFASNSSGLIMSCVNETFSAPRISQILSPSLSLCTAANQNTNQSTNHRQLPIIEQPAALLLVAYSPHERISSSTSSACLFPHENQQQQHLLIPTRENQQQHSSRTADSPPRSTPPCLFPHTNNTLSCLFPHTNSTLVATPRAYLTAEAAPTCTFSPPPPLQPPKQLKLKPVRRPQLRAHSCHKSCPQLRAGPRVQPLLCKAAAHAQLTVKQSTASDRIEDSSH